MSRAPAESRCHRCGQEVIWATLDESATRPGKRICVDFRPADEIVGGTIEIYWRGKERMARFYPRGSATVDLLRRPHFSTCPAAQAVTLGAA
jgi:hypothetical protein